MDRAVLAMAGLLSGICTGCAIGLPLQAANPDFSGAWTVKHCEKSEPSRECGVFVLYLMQQGDRICGEHFVATAGLARIDEGDPGTVLGVSHGKKAALLIKSTRNNAWHMADVEISEGHLIWHRIGMIVAGADDEPTIIPQEATLAKSMMPEHIEHLKESGADTCQWADRGRPRPSRPAAEKIG